ncbi:MAG TPA: S8 family serine peptidase, partial [Thermoanaerobaculia bacterium]|nr:S8 family serine peptidase [Thermoanaerobaculia bacterium]
YKANARIHCDSWGYVSDDGGAGYGEGEDLDFWAWNGGKPRDMLIVCSAGNDGPANRTIAPPATAKNCLTVGASTTDRNGLGDAAEILERSARGPTADNRIKPDLVAPGAWIASARTQAEKTVWHASPDQPDGWRAPPPFSWSVNRGRSGSHSWHYAREEGSSQTDRLESPPFSLPMVGRPLVLEVALAGRIGDGYTVMAQISTGGGDWEPLKQVQSVSDEWATQTFKIDNRYQGNNDLRVGIEISAIAAEAGGIDLFLDGFRITTLKTWGYLADAGLIDHGDPRDNLYDFDGGTSMAAPMVCGSAALVRQFFEQQFHVSPSAELVKATLINGARQLGTRSVPNFDEGWGRLDVESAIYPGTGKKLLFKDGSALSEQKTDSTQFAVTDPAELRLTLAWCDPPGDRLTNILGLVLYDPHGQPHFPPGASADLPDRRNNVQRIVVDTAEPGTWRAEVTASTIAGNPPVPQPFALVISGAVQATPAGLETGDPSAPSARP